MAAWVLLGGGPASVRGPRRRDGAGGPVPDLPPVRPLCDGGGRPRRTVPPADRGRARVAGCGRLRTRQRGPRCGSSRSGGSSGRQPRRCGRRAAGARYPHWSAPRSRRRPARCRPLSTAAVAVLGRSDHQRADLSDAASLYIPVAVAVVISAALPIVVLPASFLVLRRTEAVGASTAAGAVLVLPGVAGRSSVEPAERGAGAARNGPLCAQGENYLPRTRDDGETTK